MNSSPDEKMQIFFRRRLLCEERELEFKFSGSRNLTNLLYDTVPDYVHEKAANSINKQYLRYTHLLT